VKKGIAKVRALLAARHSFPESATFAYIHHGTTVATNAILESKGVCAGLVVTAGHKDLLAVRRSQIPGGLGAWINYRQPDPVIPLERTVQCVERMGADGVPVTPVDRDALRAALADLRRQRPEAVTISFLNAYRNDAHELEAAAVVREELGPDVEIVCSAQVLPEAGEYERTVTAAANAVVKPLVKKYLDGLLRLLEPDSRTIRILKSDGGLTSLALAGELPVNLLMSGPAGGVQGVVDVIANQTKYKNLITLDMGGTSTDCAIIIDGKAALRRETVVDELTVRAPSVDVRTVGAGGGSIAKFVELTSTMRVGPESAGADPGPAAYGKGGTAATVTDANLTLGYLPSRLLGGDFELDVAAAAEAVKAVGDQMGLTTEQAAEGIINLVNETMFGALRAVSSEQGYDPREFALVAFGGAGPLHANAIGKLLGAWPVIIPVAPGVLCAQGDATTKLRHEQSSSYIRTLSEISKEDLVDVLETLEKQCSEKVVEALKGSAQREINVAYEADLRFKGQALNLTVGFSKDDLAKEMDELAKAISERFVKSHEHFFGFSLPDLEFETVRVGVVVTDASEAVKLATMESAGDNQSSQPPESAIKDKKMITVEGRQVEAVFWERSKLSFAGCRVEGPCVISEMDSNTLILPGFYGEIDHVGNILINPLDAGVVSRFDATQHTLQSAEKLVAESPMVPTLIASALGAIRNEMDSLVLRASMSPGIREQQDEFNLVTNAEGKMLVGQMGSFVTDFLSVWSSVEGNTVDEGDVFITNDPYSVAGAISHLSDVIILLPIFHRSALVGWSANFGHLSDVGGCVAGSMSIGGHTIFEDGVQIPVCKLYAAGAYNAALMDTLCRNSRMPDWYRSDVAALISSCRTAAGRVCELIDRFGPDVYRASCDELLRRNREAVRTIVDTQFSDEVCKFTDFVDDDGSGVGPWVVKCEMKKEDGKLVFDWAGTSPQSNRALNFYLSTTMFKMFCGYYLLAVFDPYAVVNDGFHEFMDVRIPEGSVLKPIRPAALSCRTHLLGRVLDMIQALMGQKNKAYRAAAGFSDSPHFFYSGWKPNGDWYQLYQINFGGVPARPAGDGVSFLFFSSFFFLLLSHPPLQPLIPYLCSLT
jgi:5-oxoprolinase (ATP-hydrolysing)